MLALAKLAVCALIAPHTCTRLMSLTIPVQNRSLTSTNPPMLKVDVLSTILVQANWVRNHDEARALVANEFRRHRPAASFAGWNTHVGDDWARSYVANAVAARPDQIRFNQAFDELDTAA